MKPSGSGIRQPAVAGFFYPSAANDLLNLIKSCFENSKIGPGVPVPHASRKKLDKTSESQRKIDSFVVPHAGYEYSGPVAAHSYLKIAEKFANVDSKLNVIIFGPNHYGLGSGVALSPSSSWRTPLGSLEVDEEICEELSRNSDILDSDSSAHQKEHSIEVQLPFLQAVFDSFKIVPISMMLQDNETSKELAEAVCKVVFSTQYKDDSFLILASSDLTHYEPQKQANQKDWLLIEKISELDVNGFYTTLERNNITACGYGPIACAMRIAKATEKSSGELLKYATSGDGTGDYSAVVGYSAVQFL